MIVLIIVVSEDRFPCYVIASYVVRIFLNYGERDDLIVNLELGDDVIDGGIIDGIISFVFVVNSDCAFYYIIYIVYILRH